jgi:hypothetical protein
VISILSLFALLDNDVHSREQPSFRAARDFFPSILPFSSFHRFFFFLSFFPFHLHCVCVFACSLLSSFNETVVTIKRTTNKHPAQADTPSFFSTPTPCSLNSAFEIHTCIIDNKKKGKKRRGKE